MGISASAEDSKYHAKYKDLKRKVKELEADNDRLLFKTLQAKRSVQRMKLERAILYERLAAVPPSPEMAKESIPLPPAQDVPPNVVEPPPPRIPSEHAPQRNETMDVDAPRAFPNPPPGPAPLPADARRPPPAPNVLPPLKEARGNGNHEPPPPRHMVPIPPIQGYDGPPLAHPHGSPPHMPISNPIPHDRHYADRRPPASRSRSQQLPTQRYPPPPRDAYVERMPPMEQSFVEPPMDRSRRRDLPEMSASQMERHPDRSLERERSRPRQYEMSPHENMRPIDRPPEMERPRRHESNGDSYYRNQPPPPPIPVDAPRTAASRIHNHQRLGPGVHLNRGTKDALLEQEMEREREREWEYARMHYREEQPGRSRQVHPIPPPPPSGQHRHNGDRQHSIEHLRDRVDYPDPPPPHHHARWSGGDTPNSSGSGSGSNLAPEMPPRPDSRDYYEAERHAPPRAYRLRPVNPEEHDHPMDDSRYPRDHFEQGYPDYAYHGDMAGRPRKRRLRDGPPSHPDVVEGTESMPITVHDGPGSPDPRYPEGARVHRRPSDK